MENIGEYLESWSLGKFKSKLRKINDLVIFFNKVEIRT